MAVKKTNNVQLTDQIAEAIRMGEFRAGEWLRQIDLEQKYKATRFEVRRALDALVIRKTIEHVSNRGYKVAEISDRTQQDIVQARTIVECAAAELALANTKPTDIEQLKLLAAAFTQAVQSGTALEQSQTNHSFHRYFYALCNNPVLEEMIWSLREQSRTTVFTIWKSHDVKLLADRDHYELIDAISAGNLPLVLEATREHIKRN